MDVYLEKGWKAAELHVHEIIAEHSQSLGNEFIILIVVQYHKGGFGTKEPQIISLKETHFLNNLCLFRYFS